MKMKIWIVLALVLLVNGCSMTNKNQFKTDTWYPVDEGVFFEDVPFELGQGNYSKAEDFDKRYQAIQSSCISDYGFEIVHWQTEIDNGVESLSQNIDAAINKFGKGVAYEITRKGLSEETRLFEYEINYGGDQFLFKAMSSYEMMIFVEENVEELNRLWKKIDPEFEFRFNPDYEQYASLFYGRKSDFELALRRGFPIASSYSKWKGIGWKKSWVNYIIIEDFPSESELSTTYLQAIQDIKERGGNVPDLNKGMLEIIELYDDGLFHVMVNGLSVATNSRNKNLIDVGYNSWGYFLSYILVKHFEATPVIDDRKNNRRMYIDPDEFLRYIEVELG